MANTVTSIVDTMGAGSGLVKVECHISNGLPGILIIGHVSKAVDEAKERIRASFANTNLLLPRKRIVINLSPADLPKDSASLDLAMAVAILARSGQIDRSKLDKTIFLGELTLEGRINPVRGLIGRLLEARKLGYSKFYLPKQNEKQALLIPDIELKVASSLRDIYLDLSGTLAIPISQHSYDVSISDGTKLEVIDFNEIADQPIAKRALEIAVAGHHNILLHGPPGTGKTMLAKAMRGILPDLSYEEILEVTHLHSLSNNAISEIMVDRPFRSPHHTASTVALIGGGTNPKPGEATLAHRGILFLDELPEFSHSSIESLRQPLEDGNVTISRAKDTITYPAEFILVATQNPCPCGYFGSSKPCICSASVIAKYRKKVSGPILDRIDLHIEVSNIDHSKILNKDVTAKNISPEIKKRVSRAYEIQRNRFSKPRFNSSMTNNDIRKLAELNNDAKDLLDKASKTLDLSARAYIRSIRVARTIADLSNSSEISSSHIAEALRYRNLIGSAS